MPYQRSQYDADVIIALRQWLQLGEAKNPGGYFFPGGYFCPGGWGYETLAGHLIDLEIPVCPDAPTPTEALANATQSVLTLLVAMREGADHLDPDILRRAYEMLAQEIDLGRQEFSENLAHTP